MQAWPLRVFPDPAFVSRWRWCPAWSMGCVKDDGLFSKNRVFDRFASTGFNEDEVEGEVRLGKDKLDGLGRGQGVEERHQNGGGAPATTTRPARRPFCERCRKAQKLCICGRFKGVVENKIRVTILQHPQEKNQAIGSARIALLGLRNVAVVAIREVDSDESFRIRPKVPGSKRSITGRGGKGSSVKKENVETVTRSACNAQVADTSAVLAELLQDSGTDTLLPPKEDTGRADRAEKSPVFPMMTNTLETAVPAGVALLYPSEKAVELSLSLFSAPMLNGSETIHTGIKLAEGRPSHLIVLDGTWSKAKRLYFENTWLHSIPHYKLPPTSPSLYEGVRRQPKLGCLSTLESISYALKILEPETEGLDGLLEVFDSMVEDQRRCKQLRSA